MPASDPASTPSSSSAADRQSALLSLLYPAATSVPAHPSAISPPQQQQIPTPPASSSQRSGQSPSNNSESQGKILLEQLMAGQPIPPFLLVLVALHLLRLASMASWDYIDTFFTDPFDSAAPRSNYSDPPAVLPPLPPAPLQQPPVEPYLPSDGYAPQDTPRELPPPPQPVPVSHPQQHSPPSPRKSMFDFISPFDALASNLEPHSWTSASLGSLNDPKRKSVENLIDQLTRAQAPYPTAQPPSPSYDPYSTTDDYSQVDANQSTLQQPQQQSRPMPPPPLPPKPPGRLSPRASPPKLSVQQQPQRPQGRSTESPVGQPVAPVRRDKEGSPGPRSNWKNDARAKVANKGKSQSSPSAQPQMIVFDVSQPLDEIQAPRDAVKSTAIALVKQDPIFLPGTTIGATHWIAYAMTRGRVRVISRSSGDRTLLQLPTVFAPATQVVDMAVYGNRLAGVTSDGGFVVWELPEVITDDVPGHLLLCIVPSADADPLHSVKWHPKQADTLAVASETKMYLLDLADAARTFRGEPLPQVELNRISQVFSIPSRLVAFDFDVPHFALATISEDSTLTLWNVHDKSPFWTHRVRGDDLPSSLTFIDDGIVIGRKNGTVFQLLSVITKNVLSTFRFANGTKEDPDMFGHVNYDSRIQTLWVANNRRDSLIALKIGFDVSGSPSGELVRGGFFEQVVEFSGPKPTIHFVLLSADADPTGDEAHAACVAAKVPPGELALVAFSVHSTGVDQVLVRKEWYESALVSAVAKFPPYTQSQAPTSAPLDVKPARQIPQAPSIISGSAPVLQQVHSVVPPGRLRTPPSEEIESELTRDEARGSEAKGKSAKGKNVAFRDREDSRDKGARLDLGAISDSGVAQLVAKEIKKSEENLHTRIGRLITKEMDKQQQRFDEARAQEQAEDINRQEKILKLISTELTRNTTRVVEMAVKAEVQSSVLPALEHITRTEVRSALNEHVGRGLTEYIQTNLPMEIEKLLLRPDVSNHFASILSTNLNPLIERYVKDTVSKSFVPAYSQQTSAMHQDILREMRTEILNVKKDSMTWQTEAARSQESLIRDLEHSVRVLSDQVKFLTMNATTIRSRHKVPPIHGSWYSSPNIAAPQASHPIAPPPPPPPPSSQRSPPTQSEEWDDTYLAVLGTQDPKQLRELLARSNPEIVMPLNGPGPLSQAVILTLLHRLAGIVGETPPIDEAFKSALWWLQRAATVLNINEPLISPYIARVVPNVKAMLNTTKQRLAILPGGPQLMDSARTISEIQDTLARKQV
ncbi:hypothetical protein J3R83DRAFT_1782 [Lanmaoa asiatica]|nr:hypothetical protein J3R83DRAFT_1782 [Lanmaoa asiatica]